jgi:hypothetical protein
VLLHIFSLLLPKPTTIITLEPCALNAEFQHFILRFNKNILTLQIPPTERGDGGEREGDFTDNSSLLNKLQLTFCFKELSFGQSFG